jgi:hypothetical protein
MSFTLLGTNTVLPTVHAWSLAIETYTISKEVWMPKVGSEQDYKNKKNSGEFKSLAEGEYVFEILGFTEKEGTFHAQYNPDTIPDIVIGLKPVADAEDEDAAILDVEGKPINPDKYVNFFMKGTLAKPRGLGFGPAGASRARRLIWGALGVGVKDPLNFEWDDLVGKRIIASITIGDNGYEKVETVRPLKKNKDRSDRPRRPALVEAAAETFGEDVEY